MKLSQRLKDEQAFVTAQLPGCICHRCGATLATYADKCSADLSDACPGFLAIEAQKQNFNFSYKG
jgi:hypothetical protein